MNQSQSKLRKKIAIILTDEGNRWEYLMATHLMSTLERYLGTIGSPDPVYFHANGSHDKLHDDIMWKLRMNAHKYHAIVTLSNWTTLVASVEQASWEIPLPIFFAGVTDPVELGLIDNVKTPGSLITGVQTIMPELHKPVAAINNMVPKGRSVIIPFDKNIYNSANTNNNKNSYNNLAQALLESGYNVESLGIENDYSLHEQIEYAAHCSDVVFIQRDSTMMSNIQKLVRSCNEAKTLLFASDITSSEAGAALCYGGRASTYGKHLGEMISHSLLDNIPASVISVIPIKESDEVLFNMQALEEQGVILSLEQRQLLEMRSVFARSY